MRTRSSATTSKGKSGRRSTRAPRLARAPAAGTRHSKRLSKQNNTTVSTENEGIHQFPQTPTTVADSTSQTATATRAVSKTSSVSIIPGLRLRKRQVRFVTPTSSVNHLPENAADLQKAPRRGGRRPSQAGQSGPPPKLRIFSAAVNARMGTIVEDDQWPPQPIFERENGQSSGPLRRSTNLLSPWSSPPSTASFQDAALQRTDTMTTEDEFFESTNKMPSQGSPLRRQGAVLDVVNPKPRVRALGPSGTWIQNEDGSPVYI